MELEDRRESMFAVYDSAIQEFSDPVRAANAEVAQRRLLVQILNNQHVMLSVDDLVLYEVGFWSVRQGRMLQSTVPHVRIVSARELLNAWQRTQVRELAKESDGEVNN